ncbi:hypothetical protein [Massilibacterium senegalense]|uniref:hypothetical protein n=1 Tax=Massilibacterium senegalense TaxID=1632858 RepID=UPI0007867B67|nr:hypothetical protein [Massilibacterium senegalense]
MFIRILLSILAILLIVFSLLNFFDVYQNDIVLKGILGATIVVYIIHVIQLVKKKRIPNS